MECTIDNGYISIKKTVCIAGKNKTFGTRYKIQDGDDIEGMKLVLIGVIDEKIQELMDEADGKEVTPSGTMRIIGVDDGPAR
jgi:hypothetical protein